MGFTKPTLYLHSKLNMCGLFAKFHIIILQTPKEQSIPFQLNFQFDNNFII